MMLKISKNTETQKYLDLRIKSKSQVELKLESIIQANQYNIPPKA